MLAPSPVFYNTIVLPPPFPYSPSFGPSSFGPYGPKEGEERGRTLPPQPGPAQPSPAQPSPALRQGRAGQGRAGQGRAGEGRERGDKAAKGLGAP